MTTKEAIQHRIHIAKAARSKEASFSLEFLEKIVDEFHVKEEHIAQLRGRTQDLQQAQANRQPVLVTSTRSYATLEISASAFEEIWLRLEQCGPGYLDKEKRLICLGDVALKMEGN